VIGVTENLRKIRDLLAEAAEDAGRGTDDIRLLAVSKKQPPAAIIEAATAGQRDFGENQVLEGIGKIKKIADTALVWHFIGHLQTNKTRAVAENFDWVHSIDRLKTARRLADQRPDDIADLNVCVQVNVDDELSKSGVPLADAAELARQVAGLPRLRLRGLMCLPAIRDDFEAQREPFRRLRCLSDELRASGLSLDTLSMGMSGDFRAAVFEGSTMVRVGTAIFGARA
jgi:pyridoxal phosphate enzyme (YggS family)